MKTLIFLALAISLHAQVILSENFDSEAVPDGWTKRFGNFSGNYLTFNNRTSPASNDVFTAPMDLSGAGIFNLAFDFKSDAVENHSLIIGLAPVGKSTTYFAGSSVAADNMELDDIFSGGILWNEIRFDITPWLENYSMDDRGEMRLALVSWNNGDLIGSGIAIDNISLVDPPASAIPELSCTGCELGILAALVAILAKWRKTNAL